MIRIRGGSGLGDSLYVQSIARHFVEQGHKSIEACSDWPDVFRPLAGRVTVSPFRRLNVTHAAVYTLRKHQAGTDQFQDCCIQAGIKGPVDLRLDWSPVNPGLIETVKAAAAGRPIVAVQLARTPMGRVDGFGAELLPDCRVIQKAIDMIAGRAFLVQVGKGEPLFQFSGIDLDLANRTTVAELIDLASVAHGFLGFVSFVVPLAESLKKPALLIWSRRGLNSTERRRDFIRAITPRKILHRPSTSRFVVDDCSEQDLGGAVNGLLAQVAIAEPV